MITVTRWGREGLEPGDYVMIGGKDWLTYLLSGKIQPWFPIGTPHIRRLAHTVSAGEMFMCRGGKECAGDNRAVRDWIFILAFPLGGVISLLNPYLLYVRPLIYEGSPRMDSVPICGSLFVALTIVGLQSDVFSVLFWVGIVLIVIDTGGIHWSLIMIAIHSSPLKNRLGK